MAAPHDASGHSRKANGMGDSSSLDGLFQQAVAAIDAGDVVVFRGDQRHSYHNLGDEEAVAFSVVLLPPVGS